MMGYRTCPECGAEHKITQPTCGCGYRWPVRKQEEARDPMRGCCEYTIGTTRCHYPAVFSHSTNGGAKFYCAAHSVDSDAIMGHSIVHRSIEDYPNPDWGIDAVRRRYEIKVQKHIAQNKYEKATKFKASTPGKDWARRILERQQNGEVMPVIAIQFAREVLDA